MVDQVCWSVAKSAGALAGCGGNTGRGEVQQENELVELHRADHEGIETFARFLEESYDNVDALFYVKMRCAARKMTMPCKYNQVSKISLRAGARPQLPLNKALAAVREGIDKDAPESLKASIVARLKNQSGDGADPIDWHRFLFLCTQEYRNARCIAAGSSATFMTAAASQARVPPCAREPAVTGATTLLQQRGRLQRIKMTQPQTELKEQAFRQVDAGSDQSGVVSQAEYQPMELQEAAVARKVAKLAHPRMAFQEEAGTPTTASSPEKATDAGSTTPLSFDEFLGFAQSQSGQEENSSSLEAKYLPMELQPAASAKAAMPTIASFPGEAASLDTEPWMYALFRKHPGEGSATHAKKVWPPRSVVMRMQQEKMEDEKLTKASLTDLEACELHKNRVAAEWGRFEVGCLRWLAAFPRPGPTASVYTACGVPIMHELLQEERRQFLEL
ncbi:fabB [Symbiodinium sp. CCMP2592]|nr:fabB [Symbiodinium sp. CCMP2592]